jgi:hypothetical protein
MFNNSNGALKGFSLKLNLTVGLKLVLFYKLWKIYI